MEEERELRADLAGEEEPHAAQKDVLRIAVVDEDIRGLGEVYPGLIEDAEADEDRIVHVQYCLRLRVDRRDEGYRGKGSRTNTGREWHRELLKRVESKNCSPNIGRRRRSHGRSAAGTTGSSIHADHGAPKGVIRLCCPVAP